jgi:small multidrug resistance pump
MIKGWLYLFAAILLEVSGTTCMKLAEGFSRPIPSLLIFVFYGLSIAALVLTLKHLELGVAYAIWAGLGTALIAYATPSSRCFSVSTSAAMLSP